MLRPQQMAWGANYKRVWKKKALKKTPQELRNCLYWKKSFIVCIALYCIVWYCLCFSEPCYVDKWQWVATKSGTTLVRPWWSLFPLCRPQSQCHHFWAAAFRWPSYTFHTKEWKLAFYFDANPRPKSYQVHTLEIELVDIHVSSATLINSLIPWTPQLCSFSKLAEPTTQTTQHSIVHLCHSLGNGTICSAGSVSIYASSSTLHPSHLVGRS